MSVKHCGINLKNKLVPARPQKLNHVGCLRASLTGVCIFLHLHALTFFINFPSGNSTDDEFFTSVIFTVLLQRDVLFLSVSRSSSLSVPRASEAYLLLLSLLLLSSLSFTLSIFHSSCTVSTSLTHFSISVFLLSFARSCSPVNTSVSHMC